MFTMNKTKADIYVSTVHICFVQRPILKNNSNSRIFKYNLKN